MPGISISKKSKAGSCSFIAFKAEYYKQAEVFERIRDSWSGHFKWPDPMANILENKIALKTGLMRHSSVF
jgi:hypothetical protein